MPRFRKKPLEVEAEQFLPGKQPLPFRNEVACSLDGRRWYVVTAHEQEADIVDGDWIIREPDGRGFYPCKRDIFEATYEPVDQKKSEHHVHSFAGREGDYKCVCGVIRPDRDDRPQRR